MTASVAQQITELSCVMLPLNGIQLLLPNVCVAEIVPWRRVKVLEDAPDWCLGLLGWRGESIPVVVFRRLVIIIPKSTEDVRPARISLFERD